MGLNEQSKQNVPKQGTDITVILFVLQRVQNGLKKVELVNPKCQ